MNTRIILIGAIFFLLLNNCSKDNNSDADLSSKQQQMQNAVLDLQENSYELLLDLQQEMDSSTAVDSLVNLISADPAVDWAKNNSQGIVIQYKSGIKGGIMLNPEIENDDIIDLEDDLGPIGLKDSENLLKSTLDRILPATKKSLYISPAYEEFKANEDIVLDFSDPCLAKTEYGRFETMLDEDAYLDKFTELDKYGIIFIASHGLAWPEKNNIEEIYLMTGEKVNETTSAKYWKDIEGGIIPLILDGENEYFIGPEFVSKYNDFRNDTSFIYGGFCFSNLGSWPDKMNDAGAGGYMGYNWAVLDEAQRAWIKNFIYHMTDTARKRPMTCNEWISGTTIAKYYYSPKHKKNVSINYSGLPNLAFVDKEVTIPYNYCILNVRTNTTCEYNDGTDEYWGATIFGGNKVSGEVIDSVFTAYWDNGSSSGELQLTGDFTSSPPIITDIYFNSVLVQYDTYTEIISAQNIALTGYYRSFGGIEFNLSGPSTCSLFQQLYYRVDGGDGVYSRELISFSCDDASHINIVLGEE